MRTDADGFTRRTGAAGRRRGPDTRPTSGQPKGVARDDGFTLVELIITTMLLGLVASTISFVAITLLRTTPTTDSLSNSTAAERSLATWLSRDLASVPGQSPGTAGGLLGGATPGLCNGGANAGDNLLELSWRIEVEPAVFRHHVVNYRLVDDTDSLRIERTACGGSSFGSLTTSVGAMRLSGSYTFTQSPSAVTFTESAGAVDFVTVSLTLCGRRQGSQPCPIGETVSVTFAPRGVS